MKLFFLNLFLWMFLFLGVVIFISPIPGGTIIISITILYLAKSSKFARKLIVKLKIKKIIKKLKITKSDI